MSKGIIIHAHGGPEVMRWEEVPVGKPGPGQVRLRQTVVGLNFLDVYHRTGLYPTSLPTSIGSEAAGLIEEIGPDVVDLKPGQRVGYAGGPPGAYVEQRIMPADRLVPRSEAAAAAPVAGAAQPARRA